MRSVTSWTGISGRCSATCPAGPEGATQRRRRRGPTEFDCVSRAAERSKSYQGSLTLLKLGEPFRSGRYPGWFVPYEIRLKNGWTKAYNLCLRNDDPARRYVVDGGI
jgi:hypothetical protein